eukprot:Nitzschia sp. Nitz4//scaffold200_size39268//15184//15871//NITZ4_007616-RA/size39268-augustus-gene-0.68-mRNA-1//-1//CDS//3329541286//2944//frame0
MAVLDFEAISPVSVTAIVDSRLDLFLKPNNDFNESSGKLRFPVRFDETVQVHEIPSRADLTPSDYASLWFSEEEFQYIKSVCRATLRIMGLYQKLDPKVYCTRGLECRTQDGWDRRSRNKKLVRNAVMQEQDMQRALSQSDPEMLARVSCDASNKPRHEAYYRGIQDEKEARMLYSTCSSDEYEDEDDISVEYFSLFSP